MALDFAVTSGLRDIPATLQDPSAATASYEDYKRTHLGTERACTDEGFAFTPMVVEAVGGGWGAAASKVYSELAKQKSLISGEPEDRLAMQLYQNLSIILHRENARSILKRLRGPAQASQAVTAAALVLQAEAAEAAA